MKTILKNTLPLLVMLILASCGNDKNAQNQAGAHQAMQVPTTELPTKTVTAYTSFPTNIEGVMNSDVRAKISGYITDVLVDEGEKVTKGQTLFRLETQSMSQDAAAAKANVSAAQVEVSKLEPLVEKNIISPVQLQTAKAQLEQAKSSYSSINASIGYATIKSPVDGFVGTIRLRKGVLVSPNDQMPMTSVSQISNVYAYFSMNEKNYLTYIRNTKGKTKQEKIANFPEVTLILADGLEYDKKGKIETINSQVSRNTGTVSFRALFDNAEGLLTNGNSGIIKVPAVYEDAVVVPQESTFQQQEKTFVYKVVQDTAAVSQAITVTASSGNLYIIDSGVKAGDMIVAKGVGKVRDGMTIKPQVVPFDSIADPIKKEFQ